MQEFYYRRIGRDRRTRLRVSVINTSATIFLISFCQADKSDLPGTWSMEEKIFDLSVSDQLAEYQNLIGACEGCPRSEYKFAFAEAVKSTRHSASSAKTNPRDYPITATDLLQKIDDFLKAADRSQAP
jgi:hypothetical protein